MKNPIIMNKEEEKNVYKLTALLSHQIAEFISDLDNPMSGSDFTNILLSSLVTIISYHIEKFFRDDMPKIKEEMALQVYEDIQRTLADYERIRNRPSEYLDKTCIN